MKLFKIYSLIIVFFFSLSISNIAHADCNISDKLALAGKDLAGCNLEGANLVGANLNFANLEGADLREVNLKRAYYGTAKLKFVIWVDGRKCGEKSVGECL